LGFALYRKKCVHTHKIASSIKTSQVSEPSVGFIVSMAMINKSASEHDFCAG
jgi:hypothetical protein